MAGVAVDRLAPGLLDAADRVEVHFDDNRLDVVFQQQARQRSADWTVTDNHGAMRGIDDAIIFCGARVAQRRPDAEAKQPPKRRAASRPSLEGPHKSVKHRVDRN